MEEPKFEVPNVTTGMDADITELYEGEQLTAEHRQASYWTQFWSATRKNFILKKREYVSTTVEFFLPILFVVGIISIWAATDTEDKPEAHFVSSNSSEKIVNSSWLWEATCTNGTSIPGVPSCPLSWFGINVTCVKQSNFEICLLAPNLQIALGYFMLFEEERYIPSLDDIILAQWITRYSVPFELSENYLSTFSSLWRSGFLHFVPKNSPYTYEFQQYLSNNSYLFKYVQGLTFDSSQLANEHTKSILQEGQVWGIVDFTSVSTSEFAFTIEMNRSGIPWTNRKLSRFVSGGLGRRKFFKLYLASGFLTVQAYASQFYIEKVQNISIPTPVTVAPMSYVAFQQNVFLNAAGPLVSLLVVFSFLYTVSQLTKRIVEEKEQRIREAMLIMGLGSGSFYSSWIVTYSLFYLPVALICAILLKLTVLEKCDFFIIFLLYYIFAIASITMSIFFASFFSKARIAATLAPLIYFVLSVPMFALDNVPTSVVYVFLFIPPSCFAWGVQLLFNYEIAAGLEWQDLFSKLDDVNMGVTWIILIADIIIYFIFALYFDAVLPNEWGTRRSWYFCLTCLFKKSGKDAGGDDGRDINGSYEDDSVSPSRRPTVRLCGLRKEFTRDGEKYAAVNNMYMNLYPGQISVLLGHNGAGKTTTINLMTGMMDPDEGDCIVYGKSIVNDTRLVRQEIGFCPQHNILWASLTCREHLEYYASLKGLTGENQKKAVMDMLVAVGLKEKEDVQSDQLSGGQKRKLSVAIAFVGGSRVVFLDEPTAGMDVGARRHTWDLIKRMSHGRTIVLTTHYMDEADLLGHIIAIMSKGRLKCQGSSLFLKSRLGVGYNLKMDVEVGTPVENLVKSIQQLIPEMDFLSHAGGEVTVRLPMEGLPHFPGLLEWLESGGNSVGVKSYSISVTTLEEIFLKTAEGEDIQNEVQPNESRSETLSNQLSSETIAKQSLPFLQEQSNPNVSKWTQLKCLVTKRYHYIKRDRRTQCFQIIAPIISLIFAMLLTLLKFPNSPKMELIPTIYEVPVDIDVGNCPSAFSTHLKSYGGSGVGLEGKVNIKEVSAVPTSYNFSRHLVQTYNAHTNLRLVSFFCNDSSSLVEPTHSVAFHNASIGRHSSPEALNVYYQGILRALSSNPSVNIVPATKPLELSRREAAFIESITTLLVGTFIMIPFTFIPSTFVSFVVKERETGSKYLQTVSGMNFWIYWVSNFIFDISSFVITILLAILIFLMFQRDEYVGGGAEFGGTLTLFLFYGLAGVTGAYVASFVFENHATAQNVVMLVNFVCGFLFVLLAYILVLFPSTKSAGEALRFVFRIVPSYCLGEGIINMAGREFQSALLQSKGVFDMDVLGWNLVYLIFEFPIFAIITILIDHPARQLRRQQLFSNPDEKSPTIEDEDEDVAVERKIIESSNGRPGDTITVKHICKIFNGDGGENVAVKNLSFGVKRGEVFGFLGTNGAGKTTAIKMLCGEILPTHGRGFVSGLDVVVDAEATRRLIGYCPQFDGLLDLLSPEEHLNLWAGLRGIDPSRIPDVVNSLIDHCGLKEYRHTIAMNLSGGNKRKLSVALSLVGAPQVVFLDEPSAGMDPVARRSLWRILEVIASFCSIILTTHHLEEVEALANRVTIMVDGEMKCLGTLTHLKSKFGTGFEMSIRVKEEGELVDSAKNFILDKIPEAFVTELRGPKMVYALPPTTKLSQVFGLIEENKTSLYITDYSVSQTSLESVFLRITSNALEKERENGTNNNIS